MKTIIMSLTIAAISFVSLPTVAHHSFASTFKAGEKITIEGVVSNFKFRNPHVLLYTNVSNEDGSVTEWVSEGPSVTFVRRAGLDRESFKKGDLVRITGDATRDGSPMTSIDTIDIVDANGLVTRNAYGASRPTGESHKRVVKADPMPLTLSDGRPNLTGAWTIEGMGIFLPPRGDGPDYSEIGAAIQADYDVTTDDPQLFCEPPGLMRQAGITPHPIRITQFDDHVVIEDEEWGGRREIYFDDSHDRNINTRLGDSVARYEGDKLIIETDNLLSNLVSNRGTRLSDQTTIVETYHRADTEVNGPVIAIRVVATDPVNLNSDLVLIRNKMSAGDYEFTESECTPPLRQPASE